MLRVTLTLGVVYAELKHLGVKTKDLFTLRLEAVLIEVTDLRVGLLDQLLQLGAQARQRTLQLALRWRRRLR